MSTGVRVSADTARVLADEIVDRLRPASLRIEVAGSLRRGRPDVGDVEIVAESRQHAVPSGLFFDVEAVAWDVDEAVDEIVASGRLVRVLGKDRYTKLRDPETGLQVDLFTVKPPASWGVILTIRTGPADYSQRLVTDARRRGFHVREGSLHRGSMTCQEGRWARPCEVVSTPDEHALYAALGLTYIEPARRG